MSGQTLEERIYRFRCVEAWSSVVALGRVRAEGPSRPGGRAALGKYVAFETARGRKGDGGGKRGVMYFPFVVGGGGESTRPCTR